jgi:uncharacterized protein (DUF1800 family)
LRKDWIAAIGAALLAGCGGGGGGASSSGGGADPGPGSVVGEIGNLALSGQTLRRASFGATPALLDDLTSLGTGAWLNQQLDPASIDVGPCAPLQTLLAQIPFPSSELDDPTMPDLIAWRIANALYSPRQLQEQMLDFWHSHFSTSWYKIEPYVGSSAVTNWFAWRESELFRSHALGKFHQLLVDSATSPAMLVMLDNVMNESGSPNENYARELLELHTLGVDNGYTEKDVEQIARCFTGWTICRVAPSSVGDPLAPCSNGPQDLWSFHFDASKHDVSSKTIFKGTSYELLLPARSGDAGLQDGFDLIAHLSKLPRTAEFVSTKLIHKFVGDAAPADLVAQCKQRWKETDGDIREILVTIFNSPHFTSAAEYWSKVPTPLESLCTTIRALDGSVTTIPQVQTIQAYLDGPLNQKLFQWETPDGYPESGEKQLGTAKVLERIRFNASIASGGPDDVQYDLRALLQGHSIALDDAAAIVDFLVRLFFQGQIAATERQAAIDFLNTDLNGAAATLDPNGPDWDSRVRLTAAFVASIPRALQQ